MGDFGFRHLGYPQSDPSILEQEKFNTPIQLVRMPGHPGNGGIGVFDVRILYGIIESIMQHQKQKPPVNDRWLEVLNYHKGIARFIQYIHRPPTIKGGWGLQTTIKNSTVYSVYSPFPNHTRWLEIKTYCQADRVTYLKRSSYSPLSNHKSGWGLRTISMR